MKNKQTDFNNSRALNLSKLLLTVACFFILSCQKERCTFCEVLNHKEIYIGEICGTEDYISEQIQRQRSLYPNYDLRCQ